MSIPAEKCRLKSQCYPRHQRTPLPPRRLAEHALEQFGGVLANASGAPALSRADPASAKQQWRHAHLQAVNLRARIMRWIPLENHPLAVPTSFRPLTSNAAALHTSIKRLIKRSVIWITFRAGRALTG